MDAQDGHEYAERTGQVVDIYRAATGCVGTSPVKLSD